MSEKLAQDGMQVCNRVAFKNYKFLSKLNLKGICNHIFLE